MIYRYDEGARSSSVPLTRIAVLTLSLVLLALAAVAHAAPARAFDITGFKAGVLTQDDNDNAYFQTAGGRPPFGVTDFTFATDANGEPAGSAKSVRIDIPAGLSPNFPAFPTCTDAQLAAQNCPVESQVGAQRIDIQGTIAALALVPPFNVSTRQPIAVQIPVYNMVRNGGVARFGVNPAQAPGSGQLGAFNGDPVNLEPIIITGGVRDSDNGLFFTIPPLPTNPGIKHTRLIFWGVPGATSNDPQRGLSTTDVGPTGNALADTLVDGLTPDKPSVGSLPADQRNTAFLTNPTSCAGVQTSTIEAVSRANEVRKASYTTPVGVEDCGGVPFSPSVDYTSPEPITRDSPTPFNVHLKVPQTQDGTKRGTAHVKSVSTTLPAGVSINPSAANGLQTCSDAQFGKGTSAPVACPAGSNVGTTKITSPLLDGPITGSAYVGQSLPGERYRLFVDAYGYGVKVRLTGVVRPDRNTGQVTAIFDNNPQLPFSDLELQFKGGPHAILASPQTCGGYAGSTAFGPWSGTPTVTSTSGITVGGCAGGFGFDPGFGAAIAATQAGAYAPLRVQFNRPDGQQSLNGISVQLPPGQIAKLKGVTQCTDAQVAAVACPEASKIGVATTKAGAGSDPYTLAGSMYLTQGYRGGQFGAVVVIRAVAGPYDLGNVVVRQSISIDPNDAHVTITSDQLPQIIEGIPLRLRDLVLDINRAGFTRNATSCGPATVRAALISSNGAGANKTAGLGYTGCASLPFAPKIKLALRNKAQMGKNKHPQVRAIVTQKEGESGLKSSSVSLPKSVALAAANAQGLCTVPQAAVDKCPKASIVGSAVAETPILGKQLKGPVYFVNGERKDPKTGRIIKTLPTLLMPLRGEVTVLVRAETAVSHNRLVTTLPALPDAPITKFTLTINGGKHGIIASTRNICKTSKSGLTASARFVGQSGKKAKTQKPRLATACPKKKSSKKSTKKSGKKSTKKKSTKKKSGSRAVAPVTATQPAAAR